MVQFVIIKLYYSKVLAWIDWKLEELNTHQLCSLDVDIIFVSFYPFLFQSWYMVSKTLAEEAA